MAHPMETEDRPTTPADAAFAKSKDRIYVETAVFLAVVTAIEVSTYAWRDFPLWRGNLIVPVLLILGAVKFITVARVFMHLKFDKPLLTRVFYSGLLIAIAVYVIVLSAFRIWFPGSHL